jgi:Zn-finger nucleic acid-binding protein
MTMAVRDAKGARVDVCPGCGGVWLDWFDGDPVRLARRIAGNPRVLEAKQDGGACPRCQVPLTAEEFREVGPPVSRCDQCFGLFVPGGAVALLAAQAPELEAISKPSVWSSLAAILRRLRE